MRHRVARYSSTSVAAARAIVIRAALLASCANELRGTGVAVHSKGIVRKTPVVLVLGTPQI